MSVGASALPLRITIRPPRRSVDLIDFPDDLAQPVMARLKAESCSVNRRRHIGEIKSDTVAVLICGDDPDWRTLLGDIRAYRPDVLLIVVTRLPDHDKWLDALESGADDYCCLPLEQQHVRWLFGRESQFPMLSRGAEA